MPVPEGEVASSGPRGARGSPAGNLAASPTISESVIHSCFRCPQPSLRDPSRRPAEPSVTPVGLSGMAGMGWRGGERARVAARVRALLADPMSPPTDTGAPGPRWLPDNNLQVPAGPATMVAADAVQLVPQTDEDVRVLSIPAPAPRSGWSSDRGRRGPAPAHSVADGRVRCRATYSPRRRPSRRDRRRSRALARCGGDCLVGVSGASSGERCAGDHVRSGLGVQFGRGCPAQLRAGKRRCRCRRQGQAPRRVPAPFRCACAGRGAGRGGSRSRSRSHADKPRSKARRR